MPQFSKTVRAFLAEDETLWGVVDALAEELPGHCSASDLGECQRYLADHGVDQNVMTIKRYRITGMWLVNAPAMLRESFREQPVSTVAEFACYGMSHEDAYGALLQYQEGTGRRRMTRRAAREVAGPPPRVSQANPDPDEWTAEQWASFDAKVIAATHVLLTAFNLQQRGGYEPSVEATALLSIIKPDDLDAELRALLEQHS